jgi:hypothetical protein
MRLSMRHAIDEAHGYQAIAAENSAAMTRYCIRNVAIQSLTRGRFFDDCCLNLP